MFLVWFDDTPKKASTDKAWGAIAAYRERYGHQPTVMMVNEADAPIEIGGIDVQVRSTVQRNNFWVGYAE